MSELQAIVDELRAIRQLLERQALPSPAPRPADADEISPADRARLMAHARETALAALHTPNRPYKQRKKKVAA